MDDNFLFNSVIFFKKNEYQYDSPELQKLEAENLQKNELYRNEAEKKVVYEYLITENLSFTNYSNEKIKIDYHPVVTISGVHSCM